MSGVAMSALRVQGGRERETMRRLGALMAEHPVVGRECAVCGEPLRAGDVTAIVPLGPGPDLEVQEKAKRGGWYTAYAVVAHADCAGATEPL